MSARQPENLDQFLAQIKREERIDRWFFVAIIVLAFLAFAFLGCGARREPDHRPAPPPQIEAHLTATPPITIAGHLVTLVAWLDDPAAEVKCPTVEWTWPNGTRSEHTSDCDPGEAVTRHQEIKQGVLPSGEHEFGVRFASAGREWRASVRVPVL